MTEENTHRAHNSFQKTLKTSTKKSDYMPRRYLKKQILDSYLNNIFEKMSLRRAT